MVKLPDGKKLRIFGTPDENTREAAEEAERAHVERVRKPQPAPVEKKEVPTFEEWFNGRFWEEWVIANQNKPGEMEQKKSIYEHHLKPAFGKLRLDRIGVAEIARFRAKLVQQKHSRRKAEQKLGRKRINNVLAVLSKALRYAADVEVIPSAPKVGFFKIERPEIEQWEFEEYARILGAAKAEGPVWYAAVCLAGEAGLRIGEVRALKWREHVDLVAGTITIAEQSRHGVTGTPKGGRRRVVLMTPTLLAALKALEVVRTGFVVRNLDGTPMVDATTSHAIRRIYRRGGLPERGWHPLRHSFGTHAALLGVNPWKLQAWMGHGRIDETMIYVHVASAHHRELPPELRIPVAIDDPDRRVLFLLGERMKVKWDRGATESQEVVAPGDSRGTHVAPEVRIEIARKEKGPNLSEVRAS
jgi:integrase